MCITLQSRLPKLCILETKAQQLDAKAQHRVADVERVVLELCYEMFQDSLKHQE